MKLLREALVAAAFVATLGSAAQIPAWLDDGIANWNKAYPANQAKFLNIKDSYVWYSITGTPDLSSKDIRAKAYGIAYKSGYANTQDEEIVTTGTPPAVSGPAKAKKCWTRSFLRDVQKGSDTTVHRMLTSMVCEDSPNWAVGVRTAQ
jgi:hypothetical protein